MCHDARQAGVLLLLLAARLSAAARRLPYNSFSVRAFQFVQNYLWWMHAAAGAMSAVGPCECVGRGRGESQRVHAVRRVPCAVRRVGGVGACAHTAVWGAVDAAGRASAISAVWV